MANPSLFGIGLAASAVGLGAASFGAWVIANAHSTTVSVSPCQTGVGCPSYRDDSSSDRLGALIIGGGATLVVGGLVMSLFGLKQRHVLVGGGPLGSTGATLHLSF